MSAFINTFTSLSDPVVYLLLGGALLLVGLRLKKTPTLS
jgi:hypothetical protein